MSEKKKAESSIKWSKSEANIDQSTIYHMIPVAPKDSDEKSMIALKDIYAPCPAFVLYCDSKFSAMLSSLRATIKSKL